MGAAIGQPSTNSREFKSNSWETGCLPFAGRLSACMPAFVHCPLLCPASKLHHHAAQALQATQATDGQPPQSLRMSSWPPAPATTLTSFLFAPGPFSAAMRAHEPLYGADGMHLMRCRRPAGCALLCQPAAALLAASPASDSGERAALSVSGSLHGPNGSAAAARTVRPGAGASCQASTAFADPSAA